MKGHHKECLVNDSGSAGFVIVLRLTMPKFLVVVKNEIASCKLNSYSRVLIKCYQVAEKKQVLGGLSHLLFREIG